MGTTPKPLKILVLPPCDTWEEVLKLKAQKHLVLTFKEWLDAPLAVWGIEAFDVILGPTCWRMDESLRDYLDDAVVAARAVRYPKE